MTCVRTVRVRGTHDGSAVPRRRGHGHIWTRFATAQALLCVAAAGAFSSPAAAAIPSPRCAHASASPSHLSTPAAAHALQCLINGVRAQHGLRAVRANGRLRLAARRHADDMAAHDFFAHESPGGNTVSSRIKRAGYLGGGVREWWLGEALAWGRASAGAPRAILRGLLDSPPHRAILLDPNFRDLGVGVARGAPSGSDAGALTVDLDFGRVVR
jgi:uncharacterized protein YkwD